MNQSKLIESSVHAFLFKIINSLIPRYPKIISNNKNRDQISWTYFKVTHSSQCYKLRLFWEKTIKFINVFVFRWELLKYELPDDSGTPAVQFYGDNDIHIWTSYWYYSYNFYSRKRISTGSRRHIYFSKNKFLHNQIFFYSSCLVCILNERCFFLVLSPSDFLFLSWMI